MRWGRRRTAAVHCLTGTSTDTLVGAGDSAASLATSHPPVSVSVPVSVPAPVSRRYCSTSDRPTRAGPVITSPVAVNREPWHGQSQLFSSVFQCTTQ